VSNYDDEQLAGKTFNMTSAQLKLSIEGQVKHVIKQVLAKDHIKKALANNGGQSGAGDIDAVRKKAALTLIGELHSLISGTPDDELEAMMVQSLYGLTTALIEPEAIMKVADTFLKAKRERIEGLVSALAELYGAG
jgi:hypothetical protein